MEYKGYFGKDDSESFKILETELTKINKDLKIEKSPVKNLIEVKIKFENVEEHSAFHKNLMLAGLFNDKTS